MSTSGSSFVSANAQVTDMSGLVNLGENWTMTVTYDETHPASSAVGVSYAQIGSTFVSFSSGLSGRFDSGLLFV